MVDEGKTNDVSILFALGAAQIESVPSGAEVRTADGNYLGLTPLNLPDMNPETARFNLSLNEYVPVSLTLEILADQTTTVRTNLLNTH